MLYLGDSRDIMPRLAFDAIISDPPYGIGYQHGSGGKRGDLTNTKAIMHDDEPFDPSYLLELPQIKKTTGGMGAMSPVVLWGANHFAHLLPPAKSWLVWDKACGMGPHSSFVDSELAWCSRKTPRTVFHHLWLGILRQGEDNSGKTRRLHPSQKPVELMLWCLETARVGIGKTVVDPYMGSGSTGVAALRTGRKFIGIEKCPDYYEVARKRIDAELAQGDLFIGCNSADMT